MIAAAKIRGADRRAIIHHIQRKYNLLIGERTAELIKITIGSAYPGNEIQTMEIKGRDLVAGVPNTIEISDEEIREALMEPVRQVVESVRIALECPPPKPLPVLAGWHERGDTVSLRQQSDIGIRLLPGSRRVQAPTRSWRKAPICRPRVGPLTQGR